MATFLQRTSTLLPTFWIRLATFLQRTSTDPLDKVGHILWIGEIAVPISPSHPSTADEASLRCYVVMYCAGDILANTHMQLYRSFCPIYPAMAKCLLHSTRRYTYCIIYMYHADLCTPQEMRNAISRS